MECLSPYLCMVTVPHIMVGLERMLGYSGVGLERFHCTYIHGGMIDWETLNYHVAQGNTMDHTGPS